MNNKFWDTAGDVAFYGFAFSTVVFVVMYALFSPWRQTEVGRNIMAVMASLAATTAYFSLAVILGGVPWGFYQIRFFLFTACFLAVAWRVMILVRRQILARNDGRTKEQSDDLRS